MKMIMTTVAALAISCSALQANEDVNSGKSIYSGCKNAAMIMIKIVYASDMRRRNKNRAYS